MQVMQTLIMLGFVDAAMEVSEWLVDKKDAAGYLLSQYSNCVGCTLAFLVNSCKHTCFPGTTVLAALAHRHKH